MTNVAQEIRQPLIKAGVDQYSTTALPTGKEEAWRYTNINPILTTAFEPAQRASAAAAEALMKDYSFKHDASAELVFVNGFYAPELSRVKSLPKGVVVCALSEAGRTHEKVLEKHLGKYAKGTDNSFVALNAQHAVDGAFVYVPKNVTVEGPIHLLFLNVASKTPAVNYPRTLVVAEENAEVAIVEEYAGHGALVPGAAGDGLYLCNPVTEIVTAKHSRVDHNKLQFEARSAYHVASMHVELEEESSFISHSTSIGSAITRNDLACIMNGERAEATLNGLVIVGGTQHVDNHTLLKHEKPNCPSHELYKQVLDGKASGVFKGQIFVQKDAQKTDSKQTSKTLLLSDEAQMNSMPALEIYADDVKCTHGSTIGPVDEGAIFYLRSRGVSLAASRHLMTYAFAADITRRIKVAAVRARIEDYMAAQHGLPQDLRITEKAEYNAPLQ